MTSLPREPRVDVTEDVREALATGVVRVNGEDDLLRRVLEWTNAPSNTPSASRRTDA